MIFLRKIQRCLVWTPASTLNNTGVMLNSVDTSDNTGYSTDLLKSKNKLECMESPLNFEFLKQYMNLTFTVGYK